MPYPPCAVRTIRPWVLVTVTLVLFSSWSNSFIAIGYLLGRDGAAARFDWVGLTVARFLPASAICAAYCLLLRRADSLALLRAHWPRLLFCGALAVPGYNFALYYGQQHGVPAPIASLTTTLVPLFVMVLAALFLGERLTVRRVLGFVVAATGMVLVASSKRMDGAAAYALLVVITALAPLCWSIFSVVTKPLTGHVSPVLWTYMATAIGGLLVLPFLPGSTWASFVRLDAAGWGALLFLSIPCTVLGFALWSWLLRHLPASSVAFTVFLNPPLTTLSKAILAHLLPATFAFTIAAGEWAGAAVTLCGLALAVWPRAARVAH